MLRGFCEQLKECGRNGALFVFALGLLFVTASLGVLGVVAFAGLLVAGAARVTCEIAAQRNCFERLDKMPPLSDNDLRAARTRLAARRPLKLFPKK